MCLTDCTTGAIGVSHAWAFFQNCKSLLLFLPLHFQKTRHEKVNCVPLHLACPCLIKSWEQGLVFNNFSVKVR